MTTPNIVTDQQTVKAKAATVKIAGMDFPGYQLPDGRYAMSQNQVKALDILIGNQTGKKYAKPILANDSLMDDFTKIEGQSRAPRLMLIETFMTLVAEYAKLGNQKCLSLLIACATETLERRFDAAFSVERTLAERDQKLLDLYCNKTPRPWELRFSEEFYGHLSRLTGLEAQGNKRPVRWAQLTNQLIYSQLPKGLQQQLVDFREEEGGAKKLHQFLTANGGVPAFNDQMTMVLILMRSTSSVDELLKAIATNKFGHYQKSLTGIT